MNNISAITSPYRHNYNNMDPVSRFLLSFAGGKTGKDSPLNKDFVLKIFTDEITPIYRESGDCQKISDYLAKQLVDANFEVIQQHNGDGKGNIIAYRNVDKSKDNAIILSAHMDMVCVSKDNLKDKSKFKVHLKYDGNALKTDGTTLGADNGIGVAMALAVARSQDKNLRNIPLQIIFTVDEETGLIGAKDIPEDSIKGKYLINLDNGVPDRILTGCAGLADFEDKSEVPMKKLEDTIGENKGKDYIQMSVMIDRAVGGHSGLDINKGRINPIVTLLSELSPYQNDIRLTYFNGGDAINAIPTSAKAQILVPNDKVDEVKDRIDDIKDRLNASFKALKHHHEKSDPGIRITVSYNKYNVVKSDTPVIDPKFQKKLFNVLDDSDANKLKLKIGVITDDKTRKTKKPVTSQSLGILNIEKDPTNNEKAIVKFALRLRSNNPKEMKQEVENTKDKLSKLLSEGKCYKAVYPSNITKPWSSKPNDLTDVAIDAYNNIRGDDPTLTDTHGTVEGAAFAEKKKDLNIISIGPSVQNMHTVNEQLDMDSVEPACNILETIIKNVHRKLILPFKDNNSQENSKNSKKRK